MHFSNIRFVRFERSLTTKFRFEEEVMMLKKMTKGSVLQFAALLLVAAFALAVGACPDDDPTTGAVDKRELTAKIVDANAAKTGVVVHTAAANVNTGTYWVTQTEMDTFNAAIGAAESAMSATTQAAVDTAVTNLTAAITTFNSAKKQGTRTTNPGVNTDALTEKIGEANAAKTGVEVDTAASNVAQGTFWVTQTVMDTFDAAIDAAETALSATTQPAVDAAVSTLNTAILTFTNAKAMGTKTSGFDKEALLAKITEANSAKTGVEVDTAAGNVYPGTFWVTSAEMTALTNAINAAQLVADAVSPTQDDIDSAVTTLSLAISTFTSARKQGTKVDVIDYTALTAKIDEANTAKAGVVVNTAAGNVPSGTYWVTQAVMDTFDAAISAAQTALNATTQAAVATAVSTLNTAISAFNTAKTVGTLTAVDYESTLSWGTTPLTPLTLGLNPGNDTTEIMLNWYSAGTTAGKVAKVRFIEGTRNAGFALIEVTGAVATASTNNVSHKAKITGLKPDTSYQYSVCTDDTNWSPMYDFKVPPANGGFKFAVIADPQLTQGNVDANSRYKVGTTTAAGWVETMGKIMAAGVSFIASGGDQVDAVGGNETEYTNFFAPAGLRNLPFAPVSGNHDAHMHFTYHYNVPNQQNFDTLAPDNMGNYFYLYNNILFVVLNTAPYPGSTSAAEPYITRFRTTLTAAKTAHAGKYDWLIVQHHKSTASVGDHLADRDIQYYVEAGFETLMSEMGVDFVLAGHDHVYARSWPLKGMAGGQVSVPNKTVGLAASGSTWTGVQDPIYLTFTTGSGLKYYAVSSDTTTNYAGLSGYPTIYVKDNAAYPYLGESTYDSEKGEYKSSQFGSVAYWTNKYLPVSNAAYVQPYIPSYCIVEVNGRSITFKTYAIATVSNEEGKPGYTTGSTPTFNGTTKFSFDAEVPYDSITVTK
jgi:hypothetical protein